MKLSASFEPFVPTPSFNGAVLFAVAYAAVSLLLLGFALRLFWVHRRTQRACQRLCDANGNNNNSDGGDAPPQ